MSEADVEANDESGLAAWAAVQWLEMPFKDQMREAQFSAGVLLDASERYWNKKQTTARAIVLSEAKRVPALLAEVRQLREQAEVDAARIADLERLVGYGYVANDFRTLRNVHYQKNKVVDAALALFDDPESSSELRNCVRELRRITAPFSTAEAPRE